MTDSTTNDETLCHIREAFWSAGEKYGWTEYWSRAGVGIAVRYLNGDGYLAVKMDKPDGIYRIRKKDARQLIRKWKSMYLAKGQRLGVLPIDAFDEVYVPPCGHPENHHDPDEDCQECIAIKHNV